MGRPRTLRRLTSLFGRHVLRRDGTRAPEESLSDLCALLLSARGEASGVALAAEILDQYAALADGDKALFLGEPADRFDPDPQAIVRAAIAHAHHGSAATLAELLDVVKPPRQGLFRRLNQAPGATAHLVRLREDLMDLLPTNADLARIDKDLRHLLTSWFNRGFLVVESMTWSTSARVLERIIDYEAVHEIGDWNGLRRRLEPPDRRCYAFLHTRHAGRTARLRRSRPDPWHPQQHHRCSRLRTEAACCRGGRHRRLLFDLQLPTGSVWRVIPALPHQASRQRSRRLRAAQGSRRQCASRGISGQVEPVEVHHLVLGRHEVCLEPGLGVVTAVELCDYPQLRIRTEHEVHRAGHRSVPRNARFATQHGLARRAKCALWRGYRVGHRKQGSNERAHGT